MQQARAVEEHRPLMLLSVTTKLVARRILSIMKESGHVRMPQRQWAVAGGGTGVALHTVSGPRSDPPIPILITVWIGLPE